MDSQSFSRRRQFPIFHLTPITLLILVMLAWYKPAFCDPIHDAAASGDVAEVRALLHDHPSLIFSKNDKYHEYRTPLHEAAWMDHTDVAALLLASGADANSKEETGLTPLHDAAMNGEDVVALLLAYKAQVNARDRFGDTPLHLAASFHNRNAATVLLAHGADVNARNNRGQTPLFYATSKGGSEVAAVLIACGALVNAKDKGEMTPLHFVAMDGDKDLVELLVAHGADINAEDASGNTPLNLTDSGREDVATALARHDGRSSHHHTGVTRSGLP